MLCSYTFNGIYTIAPDGICYNKMKKFAEKEVLRLANAYTDVVEEFKYDSLYEQYNIDFLQWRRNTESKLVFRFSDNSLENFYVSGDAAGKQDAASAERTALMHCGQFIGSALLVSFIAQIAGSSLLNGILRLVGIHIRTEFLPLSMEGSQWAVVAARAVIVLLKFLLPTLLLLKASRFPHRVLAPVMLGGIPEFSAAVGAGMLISGAYALISQKSGLELAQTIFTYKDTAAIVAYCVFDTLIVSALAELFLRGSIMTLLRQFGDPFAVIITACMAALLPNNLPDRIAELAIGLAAGYLLLRSGSLTKCITLRIVFNGLRYARLIALYTHATRSNQLLEYSLLLISLGTLAASFYVLVRRHSLRLSNRAIVLNGMQKCSVLVQTVTMLPWLAVSVLLTLVQIFY